MAKSKIGEVEVEVPEQDNPVDTSIENLPEIPPMYDPKWSDYVLTQFENEELFEGNPKVDGLRRVTTKVLGPIINSRSHVVQAPNFHNAGHAVVEHEISIRFADGTVRTFGDCADVSVDNCPNKDYVVYATSLAGTRAEGRALRKALQLQRVVAAEEIGTKRAVDDDSLITNGQITFISMMCERNNINIMKLVNMGRKKYNKIEEIPYGTAIQMHKYVSAIQKGVDVNGKPVVAPKEIIGYDQNWRN